MLSDRIGFAEVSNCTDMTIAAKSAMAERKLIALFVRKDDIQDLHLWRRKVVELMVKTVIESMARLVFDISPDESAAESVHI